MQGRGTVVTGRVEQGIVRTGDEVEIIGIQAPIKTTVTGVEMFKKQLNEGQAGDNVGLLLRGTKRDDVVRGQVRQGTAGCIALGLSLLNIKFPRLLVQLQWSCSCSFVYM